MTTTPDPWPPAGTLRLHSADLFRRNGFNDGDVPDAFWDWCETHGDGEVWTCNWHDTLKALVQEHVLPVLTDRVELADSCSHHNSSRAWTVNGRRMDDVWDGHEPAPELLPAYVDVTFDAVLACLRRHRYS